jgi:hypothetical protein
MNARPWLACALAGLALLAGPGAAFGQSTPEPGASPGPTAPPASTPAGSAGEQQAALQAALIKASQNPVGNIAIIPFQNNFNYGVGPYARYQYNLNVQPVVPVMLSQSMNMIVRVIIPILNQPSAAPPQTCAAPASCGSTFGIGDVNPQIYFAPKTKPGQLIWGIGPQFQVPTATPGTLGFGKWSAGPTLVGLVMPGPWVMGVLTNQLWSFAGQTNRPAVSTFLVQPFINYNITRGNWAISTAPTITANWLATQNKWTVPLGGGVTKTFKLGDQPMQLGITYFTYVARPVSAPQTQLRVQWSLLFPVKRGGDLAALMGAPGVAPKQ